MSGVSFTGQENLVFERGEDSLEGTKLGEIDGFPFLT